MLHIGGIGYAAETQLLRQIVFAEVMAMEDIVPGVPVLDDRLTVSFDPAAKARPIESEESQAAVQRSQKKPCYDSRAELLGAIDRASHHRCEDHRENEIEGRLFREKAFVANRTMISVAKKINTARSATCKIVSCEASAPTPNEERKSSIIQMNRRRMRV